MNEIGCLIELDSNFSWIIELKYKLANKGVSLIMFSNRNFLAKEEIRLEPGKNAPRKESNLAKDF